MSFKGIKAPPRDYGIPGSDISRVFTTIGASASLVFAFNTGMLPEIQVRPLYGSGWVDQKHISLSNMITKVIIFR